METVTVLLAMRNAIDRIEPNRWVNAFRAVHDVFERHAADLDDVTAEELRGWLEVVSQDCGQTAPEILSLKRESPPADDHYERERRFKRDEAFVSLGRELGFIGCRMALALLSE